MPPTFVSEKNDGIKYDVLVDGHLIICNTTDTSLQHNIACISQSNVTIIAYAGQYRSVASKTDSGSKL